MAVGAGCGVSMSWQVKSMPRLPWLQPEFAPTWKQFDWATELLRNGPSGQLRSDILIGKAGEFELRAGLRHTQNHLRPASGLSMRICCTSEVLRFRSLSSSWMIHFSGRNLLNWNSLFWWLWLWEVNSSLPHIAAPSSARLSRCRHLEFHCIEVWARLQKHHTTPWRIFASVGPVGLWCFEAFCTLCQSDSFRASTQADGSLRRSAVNEGW